MKKTKTQKGITLVALIITIVVLLILASVAIGAAKDSDIIGYSKNASESYKEARANELDMLAQYEQILDNYSSGGNIEEQFKKFKENPEAFVHAAQSAENKDRAIGTDGKAVNMDDWQYAVIDETKKEVALANTTGTKPENPCYTGEFTGDGQIIGSVPQYIKIDGKEGVYTVTAMHGTFANLQQLKIAPKIPETVYYMSHVFYECSNLKQAPVIPAAITTLEYVFSGCNSLVGDIIIMSETLTSGNISNSLGYNENVTIKVKKDSQALMAMERVLAGSANYKVKLETF